MKISIKDLSVYIDKNNTMNLSFIPESKLSETPINAILKKIVESSEYYSAYSEHDWNEIALQIELKKEGNHLVFKEKNVEEGPYGMPSVLTTVPSILLKSGFIDDEDFKEIEEQIRSSSPVMQRKKNTEAKKEENHNHRNPR